MSDNENSGIGAAGVIGGVAGGVAAGAGMLKHQESRLLKDVLLQHTVDKLGSDGKALTDLVDGKTVKQTEVVDGITKLGKQTGNAAVHKDFLASAGKTLEANPALATEFQTAQATLKPAKAAEAAVKPADDAAKAAAKTAKEAANQLKKGAKETSAASLKTLREGTKGDIFKGLTNNQKGKVAVAAVAGVAAGAFVLNALFGGKHTSKIEAERAAPAAEPAR